MPELKAIFTGDAKPFERELRTVEALSARSAKNIERAFSGGATGGHTGSSGIIREMVVLAREISAGNVTRVPGSLSILLQRMGLLNLIFKDAASSAQILARGYAELAQQATLSAIAATQKAAATQAAFYADGEETEASLAAAVASEQEAIAARAAAAALTQKAEAATASAAASKAAATGGIGALGIVGGIIIGLAAGAYAAYQLTSSLVDKLSGVKLPDFHPEYIAKHLQKVNQTAEGWKEIRNEIEKTVNSYHAVSAAAERVAQATKTHFEHVRKIADYQKQAELAGAKTPAQKEAIERKYAENDLRLQSEERNQQLSQKTAEAINLANAGYASEYKANKIEKNVPSKEADEETLKHFKENADATRKANEEMQEAKKEGMVSNSLREAFNFGKPDMLKLPEGSFTESGLLKMANTASPSGVSRKDLDAAEKKVREDAIAAEKRYREAVEKKSGNDEARKKASDFHQEAKQSFNKSTSVRLEAGDLSKTNQQADKDAREETDAKLAELFAKLENGGNRELKQSVTEREKLGFGTTGNVTSEMLSVAKKSERHLQVIAAASKTKGGSGTYNDPFTGF